MRDHMTPFTSKIVSRYRKKQTKSYDSEKASIDIYLKISLLISCSAHTATYAAIGHDIVQHCCIQMKKTFHYHRASFYRKRASVLYTRNRAFTDLRKIVSYEIGRSFPSKYHKIRLLRSSSKLFIPITQFVTIVGSLVGYNSTNLYSKGTNYMQTSSIEGHRSL